MLPYCTLPVSHKGVKTDNINRYTSYVWSYALQMMASAGDSQAPSLQDQLMPTFPQVRRGTYFMWTEEQIADYQQWWETIPYGQDHKELRTKGNLNWDSDDHTGAIWRVYDQCIYVTTGDIGMHCKTCCKVFAHSNKHSSETSSLSTHMKSN
jgi:hypothetical protein